jgi:hypothetical protein
MSGGRLPFADRGAAGSADAPLVGGGRLSGHPGALRALAASARLANLPGTVCNVWLGMLLTARGIPLATAVCASLAGLSLYLCGAFLNDWADRRWDAAHRPERALPRGLFRPAFYQAAAVCFAVLGSAAALLASPRALAVAMMIVFCIVLYTWLHKKSGWSAVPMGCCRGLLPVLGWAACGGSAPWVAAALAGSCLFIHVGGVSLLARCETLVPVSAASLGRVCFPACAVLACIGSVRFSDHDPLVLAPGLAAYAVWTGLCLLRGWRAVASRVSCLLAGIPLVDWMLLLPAFLMAHAAGQACGMADARLWLPPLALLAGLALQRLAPAT